MAKGGEEMQFEEIYARYYKEVYYYLLSLDGNRETAEELTQETFFRAMKAIHKFKGECQLGTWLCQIAKYTYFSWKKKHRREVISDSPKVLEEDRLRSNQLERTLVSRWGDGRNPWKSTGYCTTWKSHIKKCLLCGY